MKRSVVAAVGATALVSATLLVWIEVRREREFRRLIAVGDAAVAAGAGSQAVEAFSGALAFKPDAMLAHLKRGETYLRRGDLDAALRDLGEASRLDPTAPLPLERLADVHAAMGQHARAAELYEAHLALDDRAPRVLYKLGLARFAGGEPSSAIEPLERAVALDGQLAEAHYLLGAALRGAGRPRAAIAPLARAIQLQAAFSEARQTLAEVYAQIGRRRESLEQFEAIAALETVRPERLVSLAMTYARLGRTDAALVTLGRASERFPESPVVAAAIARIWLDSSDVGPDATALSRALTILRPLGERADASSETLTLYGRALLLSGEAAAAEKALQLAVERLPVEPLAFKYLSEAAARRGRSTAVRDAAARYAALAGR